jgi:hypothetical protein
MAAFHLIHFVPSIDATYHLPPYSAEHKKQERNTQTKSQLTQHHPPPSPRLLEILRENIKIHW